MLVIACLLITVATLAYALHQISQRRKLQDFLRSEAWYLYAQSSHVLLQFEKAVDMYKRRNAGHVDPDLIEHLAKSHAFGQDLIRQTIRLIQLAEPRFDAETVERWSAEKKFSSENHSALFEILTVSSDKKTSWGTRKSSTPESSALEGSTPKSSTPKSSTA